MKVSRLDISDVILLEPEVFNDGRGSFFESFNQSAFEKATGQECTFVQDNHSRSNKNALRGLHYQLPPKAQGKLVRVIEGKIFDVVVDIRKSSTTFGQWCGEMLTSENKKQLWVPEGFAHGFIALSEVADVLYKTTDYYAPEFERCIRWDDPDIGIKWQIESAPLCSEKDLIGLPLKLAEVFV